MSVTLYVGPLIDPEDQETGDLMEQVKGELARHGLPTYEEPPGEDEKKEVFWNTIISNSALANLHSLVAALHQHPQLTLPPTHLLDPAEYNVVYLPIDFAEPIHLMREEDDEDEDGLILESCQAMMREIEMLAGILGIPLDRFPIDQCGDGSDVVDEWDRITQELAEGGALIMKVSWAPTTEEGLRERIRQFCAAMGASESEESMAKRMIEEHGSLKAAFSQEDSPEQKSTQAMWALVSLYHAGKMALELQRAFQFG